MGVVAQTLFVTTGFTGGGAGVESATFTTPLIEVPSPSCQVLVALTYDVTLNAVTGFIMNIRRGAGVGGANILSGQPQPFTASANNRFHAIGCDLLLNQATVQYTVTVNPTAAGVGAFLGLDIAVMLFF